MYDFLSYSMIYNHEQITSSENYKVYLNLCFKYMLVKLILVHIWQIDTIIAVLVLHIPSAYKYIFFTLPMNCDRDLKNEKPIQLLVLLPILVWCIFITCFCKKNFLWSYFWALSFSFYVKWYYSFPMTAF